ncbi:PEGA domain protein [Luteitalea pratensis]|uniref:PEGA domain protein n=1 Tax=Luteitalea pratensis TaxID=1855912 RepID=A0A143PTW4_LUTPR|nr:PEGA domain-containing protein [Luteitalea pratensis]AMY11259.1 PEGA domain protein [Luteitalea pratensis]
MRSLEEPDAPRGRRLLWILLGVAMLGGLVAWYATTRTAPPDAPAKTNAGASLTDVPTSGNERPATTERPGSGAGARAAPPAGPPRRADRAPARPATATPAPAAREFRVTTDVPGAYVFLDRKFLGTTPFVSRDVAPGRYQLNVQVEGRPPVVRTVEVLADAPTTVDVTMPPAARTAEARASVDMAVAVVHQHGVGSCDGTLRATGDGLRYETAHKDAFSLPYASVETFTVDYAEKRLRLKQRSGRAWNFTTTAANADPLFVFHRDVEAARK